MYPRHLLFIVSLIVLSGCNPDIKVIKGHAHNDYENENPLHDALDNGFISVEADVHLVDDQLYVSHDLPEELDTAMTLEALYLNPLKEHIVKNKGSVYRNYSGSFYLLIDFKSSAKPSYEKLKKILQNYLSIISVVQDGVEQKRAVKILISGNRPVDEILNDEPKLVGIDGRPFNLGQNIPVSIMPVISENFSNFLSWKANGDLNEDQYVKLKKLVQNTHAQNKELRLWGIPDNENAWRFLLDNGVDLINTDHIEAFREFVLEYDPSSN